MVRANLTNGPGDNVNERLSQNPPVCGRSVRWLFVLNNYTEAETEVLNTRLTGNDKVVYLVYGKEVAPTTGTPHLQGFIIVNYRVNLKGIIKLFGLLRNGVNPVHFRISTCKVIEDAADYCKKDGNVFEYGTLPAPTIQGKDGVLVECIQAMKDGMLDKKVIREKYPGTYSRHRQLICELILDLKVPKACPLFPLRVWQADLYSTLRRPTNDRTIIFVVDIVGNSGKTWFHRYYRWLHPENTQAIPNSCYRDMAYMLDEETTTLFVDVRRADKAIEYSFLEAVKDGEVDATKYNSHVKKLNACHVVVFTNRQPNMDELSHDRYEIINITPQNNICLAAPVIEEIINETQTIVDLSDNEDDSIMREVNVAITREIVDLSQID